MVVVHVMSTPARKMFPYCGRAGWMSYAARELVEQRDHQGDVEPEAGGDGRVDFNAVFYGRRPPAFI